MAKTRDKELEKHAPKREVGPVTLGNTYTDSVMGIEGKATCYAIHLTGCNRVCLERILPDGEVREYWVDENRLVDQNQKPVIDREAEKEPGPGNDPPSRSAQI